jgi:hypothetical protein
VSFPVAHSLSQLWERNTKAGLCLLMRILVCLGMLSRSRAKARALVCKCVCPWVSQKGLLPRRKAGAPVSLVPLTYLHPHLTIVRCWANKAGVLCCCWCASLGRKQGACSAVRAVCVCVCVYVCVTPALRTPSRAAISCSLSCAWQKCVAAWHALCIRTAMAVWCPTRAGLYTFTVTYSYVCSRHAVLAVVLCWLPSVWF